MDSEFALGTRTRLFAPLSIAAYVTWSAIAFTSAPFGRLGRGEPAAWVGMAALVTMIALFVLLAARGFDPSRHRGGAIAAVVGQGLLVLLAQALLGGGAVPILLIIVAAQLFTMMPVGWATVVLAVLNAGLLGLWRMRGFDLGELVLSLLPMLGFQAFAALTSMYAERSERRGDALAELNAELLATQRLLEESTRSDERLNLSRELHDVAGHKLTALKLHLRALHRNPALAGHEALAISLQLADELLADIRAVVSELRQHDGIQLGDALQALARPLPGVRIELNGREQARVATVAQAEALLRFAQEGLTNALRHGQATRIELRVENTDGRLRLSVEDDGSGRLPIDEGNGLRGMRERLAAFGGELRIEERAPQGLSFCAELPAAAGATA
ncbi:MAG: sensor histidine kinase [Silanimonas sp.]